MIFTHTVFIFNCPACVPACMYTKGISGVCSHPGPSDILPEASSQPISHTVPQCTIAPQRVRPGLLRTGPQHPATLWYACTKIGSNMSPTNENHFFKKNFLTCHTVSQKGKVKGNFGERGESETYYSAATLLL